MTYRREEHVLIPESDLEGIVEDARDPSLPGPRLDPHRQTDTIWISPEPAQRHLMVSKTVRHPLQ
mgnify:CR=1 FL=1